MQDLMTDGQCPFSPPRAPPHGFPHFLFAAAAAAQQQHHQQQQQQQQPNLQQSPVGGRHLGEDPASALMRERAMMALDSFLQQQQQQQNQTSGSPYGPRTGSHLPPTSGANHPSPSGKVAAIQACNQPQVPSPSSMGCPPPAPALNQMNTSPGGQQQQQQPPLPSPFMPFGLFLPDGPPPPPQSMPPTSQQQPTSTAPGGGGGQLPMPVPVPANFEQFLLQRQQFAAAMAAAAAASSSHHPLHSLFSLNGPPFSLSNQANI